MCNSLKSPGNDLQIVSGKGWQMDEGLSVEADRAGGRETHGLCCLRQPRSLT